MNKIKILTVLSMMFGLLIMSAPVDSFAERGTIRLRTKAAGYFGASGIYFPDTGYVCTNNMNRARDEIGKFVLPKNLNLKSLAKLKGTFPGVEMHSQEVYIRNKRENYKKNWADIDINKDEYLSWKIDTGFNAGPSKSELYCNRNKFDVMFKKYRADFLKGK